MKRHWLSMALLAICLLFAASCSEEDMSTDSLDEAFKTAKENVQDAAENAAGTLEEATDDFGAFVEDAVDDAERAIDGQSSRRPSEAK